MKWKAFHSIDIRSMTHLNHPKIRSLKLISSHQKPFHLDYFIYRIFMVDVLQNVFCQVVNELFIYTSNTLTTTNYSTLLYSTLYVSGFYFSIATSGPKPWDHLPNQTLKCRSSNLKINMEYFGLRRCPNACCYEKFASNQS
jgi:hypothetical protein